MKRSASPPYGIGKLRVCSSFEFGIFVEERFSISNSEYTLVSGKTGGLILPQRAKETARFVEIASVP